MPENSRPHRAVSSRVGDAVGHESGHRVGHVVVRVDRAGLEATGMVIDAAVRRDEDGRPVLLVCTGTEPNSPFDRRAEEWRTHFQDLDYEAEWSPERNRFEYDTGVTGFPVVHVDTGPFRRW